MKKLSIILSLSFLVLFALQGCKKNGGGTITGNNMHVHFKVGTADLNLNQTYQDKNGRNFQISKVQFYLSNLKIELAGGTELEFPNEYMIINSDQMMYSLPDLEAGHYHGLSFDVGVDSASNHSDPALWPNNHPLSPTNSKQAHWSWNSGYIFVLIEGLVDTSAAGTGAPTELLEMHVGTDNMLRSVSFNAHTDVEEGSPFSMHLEVDLLEVFDQLDLAPESNRVTHTMDNMSLAMTIANQFSAAIVKE